MLYDIIIRYTLRDLNMQESESPTRKSNGRWTKDEHLKFLEGLRIHGKNWKKIEQLVDTRSGSQIRSHAQKFFLKAQDINPQDFHSMSHEEQVPMEAQEVTLNSKPRSESTTKRDDVSFFLGRIMQLWEDGQGMDFWRSLVDQRHATENSNEGKKNNSFTKMRGTGSQSQDIKGPCSTLQ